MVGLGLVSDGKGGWFCVRVGVGLGWATSDLRLVWGRIRFV